MKKHLKKIGLFVGGTAILFFSGFIIGYCYGFQLLFSFVNLLYSSRDKYYEFTEENKRHLEILNDSFIEPPTLDDSEMIIRFYFEPSFEPCRMLELKKRNNRVIAVYQEKRKDEILQKEFLLENLESKEILKTVLSIDYCQVKSVMKTDVLSILGIDLLELDEVIFDGTRLFVDFKSKNCSNQFSYHVDELEIFSDPMYQKIFNSFLNVSNSIKNDSLLSNMGKD